MTQYDTIRYNTTTTTTTIPYNIYRHLYIEYNATQYKRIQVKVIAAVMKQLKQLQRKPRKKSEALLGFKPMTSAIPVRPLSTEMKPRWRLVTRASSIYTRYMKRVQIKCSNTTPFSAILNKRMILIRVDFFGETSLYIM